MGSTLTLKRFQANVAVDDTPFKQRSWVRDGHIHAYLRVATHYWPNDSTRYDTLDFANGGIEDESLWNKGHFTKFVDKLEAWADELGRAVYFENVLNPILVGMLERRGYESNGVTDLPCFLRRAS